MYLATYQIRATLDQDCTLPPYLGSLLRHQFERTFRSIVCVAPDEHPLNCFFKGTCPASDIFDMDLKKAMLPTGDEKKPQNIDIPKPFIIEAPFNTQPYEKRKGEEVVFNLILVGRAISHFPLFVLALKEVGRIGIAENKIRFKVERVDAVDALHDSVAQCYNAKTDELKNSTFILPFKQVLESFQSDEYKKVTKITIDLLTPFRVKRTQKALESPDFFLISRSLLRRMMSLSRFHCSQRIPVDYKKFMDQAAKVKLVKNEITWFDWGKYSPKNESKAQIGGLFGRATYEGPVGEFLPYLIYGQLVHIGKNTSYGLGKFKVDFDLPLE